MPRANPVRLGKNARLPTHDQVVDLFEEMDAVGEAPPPRSTEEFRLWVKTSAERSLYFFNRWVMGFKDMAQVHRDACAWLTDFSKSRNKLFMIPVGHLKTSMVSHGMPIHIWIQPADHDIYFPKGYSGGRGRDARIALGNENQDKAGENLSFIAETLENNSLLVWLWPEIIWDNVNDSPKWAADAITLPRTRPYPEPSLTALGIENAITGRHYDAILADDIATMAAAQSPPLMERAAIWLRRSFTRLQERYESIHIGVGTPQNMDDVYVEWEKRASVECIVRAIEEKDLNGDLQPIWPERYSKEVIAKIREDTDAITYALWYMCRRVQSGFSALDWAALREFRWHGTTIGAERPFALEFEEVEKDEEFRLRSEAMKSPLARFAHGIPLTQIKGNREQMIGRFFGKTMSAEQREHLRGKYDGSPASTQAKEILEEMLGNAHRDR